MKIREGFMLRQVGSQAVVVAIGDASRDFNGIIKLNPVGKFSWEALSEDRTEAEVTAKVLEAYEIDEKTAAADVSAFIAKLREADLLA